MLTGAESLIKLNSNTVPINKAAKNKSQELGMDQLQYTHKQQNKPELGDAESV